MYQICRRWVCVRSRHTSRAEAQALSNAGILFSAYVLIEIHRPARSRGAMRSRAAVLGIPKHRSLCGLIRHAEGSIQPRLWLVLVLCMLAVLGAVEEAPLACVNDQVPRGAGRAQRAHGDAAP